MPHFILRAPVSTLLIILFFVLIGVMNLGNLDEPVNRQRAQAVVDSAAHVVRLVLGGDGDWRTQLMATVQGLHVFMFEADRYPGRQMLFLRHILFATLFLLVLANLNEITHPTNPVAWPLLVMFGYLAMATHEYIPIPYLRHLPLQLPCYLLAAFAIRADGLQVAFPVLFSFMIAYLWWVFHVPMREDNALV